MRISMSIALLLGLSIVELQSALGGEAEAPPGDRRILSVHLQVGGGEISDQRLTIWGEAYLSSVGNETTYRRGSFGGFLLALAEDYGALGTWWRDLDCMPATPDSDYLRIYLLLGNGEVRRHLFRGVCKRNEAVDRVLRLLCGFKLAGFGTPSGRPFEITDLACAATQQNGMPHHRIEPLP
jgi:hypothetical protein